MDDAVIEELAGRPREEEDDDLETSAPFSITIDWERLSRDKAHPTIIDILQVLGMDGGRILSPTELSLELQQPFGVVNHRLRTLRDAGFVEAYDTQAVRGAVETFYCLSPGPTH